MKQTGWRIPLLFSIAIVGIAAILYLFLPANELPELPEGLTKKAQGTTVDLNTPENGVWKKGIIEAASGFGSQDTKDNTLKHFLGKALGAKRLDIACAGSVLVKTTVIREEVLNEILSEALSSCQTLHFGVCTLVKDSKGSQTRAMELLEKYAACEKERGAEAPLK